MKKKLLAIFAVIAMVVAMLPTMAFAEEPECRHVVYCENLKVCILCGRDDLKEGEITEIKHLYAYCYDTSRCGVCRRPFEEGEIYEIRHNTDYNVKYVPAGRQI